MEYTLDTMQVGPPHVLTSPHQVGPTRGGGLGFGLACSSYLAILGERTAICGGSSAGRAITLPVTGPLALTLRSQVRRRAWDGMVRYGVVLYGMVWCGMAVGWLARFLTRSPPPSPVLQATHSPGKDLGFAIRCTRHMHLLLPPATCNCSVHLHLLLPPVPVPATCTCPCSVHLHLHLHLDLHPGRQVPVAGQLQERDLLRVPRHGESLDQGRRWGPGLHLPRVQGSVVRGPREQLAS